VWRAWTFLDAWLARSASALGELFKELISRFGIQLHRYNVHTLASGSVLRLASRAAIEESFEFIRPHLETAVLFEEIPQIQRYAIRSAPRVGLLCEFGVYRGASIRRFARELKTMGDTRTIHGFDSFEGLEEDWRGAIGYPRAAFDLRARPPKTPPHVHLIKGWVQETLPGFIRDHAGEKFAFVHIDLDTYTPSRFVLGAVKPHCTSGTVILFDELYGYPNWRNHEYKALTETFDPHEYEFIALSNKQAAIRITSAA
jgi:hypothetical protein